MSWAVTLYGAENEVVLTDHVVPSDLHGEPPGVIELAYSKSAGMYLEPRDNHDPIDVQVVAFRLNHATFGHASYVRVTPLWED